MRILCLLILSVNLSLCPLEAIASPTTIFKGLDRPQVAIFGPNQPSVLYHLTWKGQVSPKFKRIGVLRDPNWFIPKPRKESVELTERSQSHPPERNQHIYQDLEISRMTR